MLYPHSQHSNPTPLPSTTQSHPRTPTVRLQPPPLPGPTYPRAKQQVPLWSHPLPSSGVRKGPDQKGKPLSLVISPPPPPTHPPRKHTRTSTCRPPPATHTHAKKKPPQKTSFLRSAGEGGGQCGVANSRADPAPRSSRGRARGGSLKGGMGIIRPALLCQQPTTARHSPPTSTQPCPKHPAGNPSVPVGTSRARRPQGVLRKSFEARTIIPVPHGITYADLVVPLIPARAPARHPHPQTTG